MNNTENKKILIIEDDPLSLKLEKIIFERAGYQVFEAINGEEGVKIALEEKPCIIIIDYLLPEMSGLDVVEKIRNDGEKIRNIPCVIVTAAATQNEVEKFKKSKINGYLIKPLDINTFVSDVEKLAFGK